MLASREARLLICRHRLLPIQARRQYDPADERTQDSNTSEVVPRLTWITHTISVWDDVELKPRALGGTRI